MPASSSWYAVHGPNGDLTWRVTGPAEALGAKLHLIPEEEGDALAWPNTGEHFPWLTRMTDEHGTTETIQSQKAWKRYTASARRLTSITTEYPSQEGTSAVFTRPMSWFAAHMLRLRENGVRVLAECDDNYMSPSRLNVMFQTGETTDDDRDNHARSICSTDGIIVSTRVLRDQYHKQLKEHFPGLPIPPIHVCRNHVDDRHIPTVPEYDGPVRVGFMGSDSHVWDVDLVFPALAASKERGCKIVMMGIHPLHINPKYRRKKWDWASLDYEYIPWKLDYRGTAIPMDVGLAPLVVNSHTLCKSDIKWLEYGMSGAACVAQNCEVFSRSAKHGETALLAGSPTEFVQQTLALVGSETLRRELADNTMTYIREERLLKNNVDEWKQAIYG